MPDNESITIPLTVVLHAKVSSFQGMSKDDLTAIVRQNEKKLLHAVEYAVEKDHRFDTSSRLDIGWSEDGNSCAYLVETGSATAQIVDGVPYA